MNYAQVMKEVEKGTHIIDQYNHIKDRNRKANLWAIVNRSEMEKKNKLGKEQNKKMNQEKFLVQQWKNALDQEKIDRQKKKQMEAEIANYNKNIPINHRQPLIQGQQSSTFSEKSNFNNHPAQNIDKLLYRKNRQLQKNLMIEQHEQKRKVRQQQRQRQYQQDRRKKKQYEDIQKKRQQVFKVYQDIKRVRQKHQQKMPAYKNLQLLKQQQQQQANYFMQSYVDKERMKQQLTRSIAQEKDHAVRRRRNIQFGRQLQQQASQDMKRRRSQQTNQIAMQYANKQIRKYKKEVHQNYMNKKTRMNDLLAYLKIQEDQKRNNQFKNTKEMETLNAGHDISNPQKIDQNPSLLYLGRKPQEDRKKQLAIIDKNLKKNLQNSVKNQRVSYLSKSFGLSQKSQSDIYLQEYVQKNSPAYIGNKVQIQNIKRLQLLDKMLEKTAIRPNPQYSRFKQPAFYQQNQHVPLTERPKHDIQKQTINQQKQKKSNYEQGKSQRSYKINQLTTKHQNHYKQLLGQY